MRDKCGKENLTVLLHEKVYNRGKVLVYTGILKMLLKCLIAGSKMKINVFIESLLESLGHGSYYSRLNMGKAG